MSWQISCAWLPIIDYFGEYPVSLPHMYEAIDLMKRWGFRFIELEAGETNLEEVYADRKTLRSAVEAKDCSLVNFCPVLPSLTSLDPVQRRQGQDSFRKAVEIAVEWGCSTIQVDSYHLPLQFRKDKPYTEMVDFEKDFQVELDPNFSWPDLWKVLQETFIFCGQTAQEAGLKFCIEPRVGEILSNTASLLRLMDATASATSNIGMVMDASHLYAQKEILVQSIEMAGSYPGGSRIFYVHVADNDGRTNLHLAPGEGTIDWYNFFRALQKHHFEGAVALDVGRIPPRLGTLEEHLRKGRDYLCQHLSEGGFAYEV